MSARQGSRRYSLNPKPPLLTNAGVVFRNDMRHLIYGPGGGALGYGVDALRGELNPGDSHDL